MENKHATPPDTFRWLECPDWAIEGFRKIEAKGFIIGAFDYIGGTEWTCRAWPIETADDETWDEGTLWNVELCHNDHVEVEVKEW